MKLRIYLITVFIAFVVTLMVSGIPSLIAQPKPQFTEWGWPLPYEKVSEKSINYLKEKGWWPIVYAYQPLWLGQSIIKIAGDLGLDRKRGLDIQFQAFLSGPPVNEAVIAGKAQFGSGGPFPTTVMVDKKANIKGIAVISYGYRHAMLIPTDSPIMKPEDFKGKKVGLVVGSGGEYGFISWTKANKIDIYKDVSVLNFPIPEQAAMPKGLDAVVPWDPAPDLMINYRKNARLFADTTEFMYYFGTMYCRKEIIENAPDVAQALVDILLETVLYSRYNPSKASEFLKKDPILEAYPTELITKLNSIYVNNLKPTWVYPFKDYISVEGERVAKWLFDGGRLTSILKEGDFKNYLITDFMDRSFNKIGWKIPKEPPYFPKGTSVDVFKNWVKSGAKYLQILPYHLTSPQPFPESSDLMKEWYFNGKWYQVAK
jgi:ABC-type nitrate/sulfonate/bicarbonate transport system substrate-binding protein